MNLKDWAEAFKSTADKALSPNPKPKKLSLKEIQKINFTQVTFTDLKTQILINKLKK